MNTIIYIDKKKICTSYYLHEEEEGHPPLQFMSSFTRAVHDASQRARADAFDLRCFFFGFGCAKGGKVSSNLICLVACSKVNLLVQVSPRGVLIS